MKDSDGKTIGRYTTGTDGTAIVSGLTPNATIVVSETKAPTSYIKDETPKNIVVRSGVANTLIFDDEPADHPQIYRGDGERTFERCVL